MNVSMAEVTKFRSLFITLQRQHGINEIFNINDAKWTLRDIIIQIGDKKEVEKLIKFFFITSDHKTWDDFQYNYDAYYDAWNEYRISRAQRLALQQQTLDRRKSLES